MVASSGMRAVGDGAASLFRRRLAGKAAAGGALTGAALEHLRQGRYMRLLHYF